MLTYDTLKTKPREFLAMTGVAIREFEEILLYFANCLRKAEAEKGLKEEERQRKKGGGRKAGLKTDEDKLLFALVYAKTYPLQAVQGQLFGMGQSSASDWIHFLLPVLRDALDEMGMLAEREGELLAKPEKGQKGSADLIVDGVERPRQRPKEAEKQKKHYSGKKKGHYDKNLIAASTRSKRVRYLGPTSPGSQHDRSLAEESGMRFSKQATVRSDLGLLGYNPQVKSHLQPKKSRAGRS
jgi:hypothetical protein